MITQIAIEINSPFDQKIRIINNETIHFQSRRKIMLNSIIVMDEIITLIIVISLVIGYCVWKSSQIVYDPPAQRIVGQENKLQLETQLQMLFLLETDYLREYIIRMVYQLPGQQEVSDRIMSNSMDMVTILDYLYPGHYQGLVFFFKKQINLFMTIVTALVTHDGENYDEASLEWKNNAAFLATELYQAHPSFSVDQLRNLLTNYQKTLDKEIRANLQQKVSLVEFDATRIAVYYLTNYLVGQKIDNLSS